MTFQNTVYVFFYHCQFVKPAINRLIPCSHDIKRSRRMRRPDCVRDISWCKHNMCFFGYHCYPLSSNDKLHSLGAIWLLLHDWSLSNYTGMMAMSKYQASYMKKQTPRMVVLFFMMIMVMVVMIIIGHHAKDDDGKHYQRTVPRDRFSTLGPLLWLCALHHFIFQFTSDINCFGQKFDSDKKLELTTFWFFETITCL